MRKFMALLSYRNKLIIAITSVVEAFSIIWFYCVGQSKT